MSHNRGLMELGRVARKRLRMSNPTSSSSDLKLVQSSVLFRHGDRSPSINVFEPDVVAASHEAFAWAAELPTDATLSNLELIAPTKRVVKNPNTHKSMKINNFERPRDAELGSFGRLSRAGVHQAHDLGSWLSGFYSPSINSSIDVTSSNYARTIATAQAVVCSFLPGDAPKGVIKIQVHDPNSEFLNVYPFFVPLQQRMLELTKLSDFDKDVKKEKQRLESLLPTFSFHLRKFSWLTCQDHFRCRELRRAGAHWESGAGDNSSNYSRPNGDESHTRKRKKFLPRSASRANSVDGVAWKDSWLRKESLTRLRATFDATDHDHSGTLSKRELTSVVRKYLPSSIITPKDIDKLYNVLRRRKGSGGKGDLFEMDVHDDNEVDMELEIDEGVDWNDFVQLVGDGLPSLTNDKDEEELWSLRPIVEEYTIRRFAMWYKDKDVLSMATGGLINALLKYQNTSIEKRNNSHLNSTVVHYNLMCGHDVTILPLLHLLGAKHEANQWPGYCCVLMLELMVDENTNEYYVRVLWHPGRTGVGQDREEVNCRPLLLQQDDDYNGGKEYLTLKEFQMLTSPFLNDWLIFKGIE
jgi:hypothetical protein